METHTKETITTDETGTEPVVNGPRRVSSGVQTVQSIIYYLFGALEVLLTFRLLLRLFGANPDTMFVSWIYSFTAPFIAPFLGIFPASTTQGAVTTAVFEPATLLAIIVYAFIAWGIARLIGIFAGQSEA